MSKYSADIEIAVRGGQQLNNTIKALNRLNNSINVVNRNAKLLEGKGFNVASIENYSRAVSKAERAVRKAAEGTNQERQAITALVSAMELENKARERKNLLITREIANQRRVVATANAGFGVQGPAMPRYMQGPAVPPGGIPKRSRAGAGAGAAGGGGGGGGRLGGAISGSIIGGAFPLLFGQGAGAATGGAVGGLVGGLAGPGGSFAGSLLGTLLGDIAEQGGKIKELADDIGFSADQTTRLQQAFSLAGQEADKFQAAVQNIRGLGLTLDDQADAIALAANLTEAYGGKIDKIAAAYANFVEKGKVGISDINKFTSEGIPILDELEKKYNTNRDGILKLAKDGKISAQDLSDALINIGNSSDTAVRKTVSGWDKAWADIKAGGSLFVQAVGAYFNALTGSAGSSTASIAESFGSMFKNIVQNSIDATAALARNLANLARFSANLSATVELGGLNIGATASKNIAKNIEKTARDFDAALQNIQLPTPGKVGSIAVPGQAPATGNKAAKGPKPPEDRTQQLIEEFNALVAIGQAEDKIRDLLFQGRDLLAAEVELEKQLADITRDRNKALMGANYESERMVINKIAEARIVDAQLRTEDKMREIRQRRFEEELQVKEAVRSSVQAFTDMRQEQELQVQFSKTYYRLLAEGVLPAEAERIANFDKLVSAQLNAVELQIQITQAAILEAEARGLSTAKLQEELDLLKQKQEAITGEVAKGPGVAAAESTPEQKITEKIGKLKEEIAELTNIGNIAIRVADGIGAAFGQAFAGLISGSMSAREALSSFFKSVGDMFIEMASEIIAKQMTMIILQTILKALGAVSGGGGFSPLSNADATSFGFNPAPMLEGPGFSPMGRAGGGPAAVGTPYLVGERGPELFVPGTSGGVMSNSDLRSAMNSQGGGGSGSPVLNMSFESTTIGGVEYVSRDQLEQAMAETRRSASRDGAQRGMTMTLDRIQNSSSTRRRVGI